MTRPPPWPVLAALEPQRDRISGVIEAQLPETEDDLARLAQQIVAAFEREPSIAVLVVQWWPDADNVTVIHRGGRA